MKIGSALGFRQYPMLGEPLQLGLLSFTARFRPVLQQHFNALACPIEKLDT